MKNGLATIVASLHHKCGEAINDIVSGYSSVFEFDNSLVMVIVNQNWFEKILCFHANA